MSVSEDLIAEINSAISDVSDASDAGDKVASETGGVESAKPLVPEEESSEKELTPTQTQGKDPVEKSKEEATPAPKATPTETKSQISDEALTRAVVAGISVADARSFQSDEALLRVVERVEGVSKSKQKEEPAAEEDPFAGVKPLDPEVYEPEVVGMFDTLLGIAKKQHEELKKFKENSERAAQSSASDKAQEIERWFDASIAKLGEDFGESLGVGPMAGLNRSSTQYAKRDAIANYVVVLKKGREGAGLQPKPLDELFQEAAQLVLKDEILAVKEKRLAGDLADRSSQHISRATGQTGQKKETPEEATARILEAKYFKK